MERGKPLLLRSVSSSSTGKYHDIVTCFQIVKEKGEKYCSILSINPFCEWYSVFPAFSISIYLNIFIKTLEENNSVYSEDNKRSLTQEINSQEVKNGLSVKLDLSMTK